MSENSKSSGNSDDDSIHVLHHPCAIVVNNPKPMVQLDFIIKVPDGVDPEWFLAEILNDPYGDDEE